MFSWWTNSKRVSNRQLCSWVTLENTVVVVLWVQSITVLVVLQSPGATQADKGAMGGQNTDLAWGTQKHAQVRVCVWHRHISRVFKGGSHGIFFSLCVCVCVCAERMRWWSTWRSLRTSRCTVSTTLKSKTRRAQSCGWASTPWDSTSTSTKTSNQPTHLYTHSVASFIQSNEGYLDSFIAVSNLINIQY